VVADSAGILIASVPGSTPCFYVNDPTYATDLTDLLVFDHGSTTTARFRVPVGLSGPVDSLFVMVSDNMLNQTVIGVPVRRCCPTC